MDPIDTPTATRLLEEALLTHGYHGLYLDGIAGDSCGCRIGDLFPCEMSPDRCRAGWLKQQSTDEDPFIGPTPRLCAADLEAIGQQRLVGLSDEETE